MDDRQPDKQTDVLLDALRSALADTGEHRLYRSGKLTGLFPSKSGVAGDAAALALREGYLEAVRSEIKGKIAIEWVRLAPAGVEFIYHHDTPRAVLEQMRSMMDDARSGVPRWLNSIQEQMQTLSKTFAHEMHGYLKRLDALTRRVEEALRRIDAGAPTMADPLQALVPWGLDALSYLDRRKLTGTLDPCPLPELFASLRKTHPHLSVSDFQKGLRRLADNRAVTLLPYVGNGLIPEPEHAIPDGAHMLYFISR
ncbi:MAG: hypothetical protein K8T89_26090 [Planctomycetes bacterium]|nr:hypothetical protein [Planctomycetota bacterium]